MDGFEANKGVVVIAATNRADILDQALVRPGRFDRQIQVDPPDVQGRSEILKVHAKGKNLAAGVDLTAIARQTPGMSGADLANLLNEGAIVAARQNKAEIDSDDIFNALERISIGLEKKDAVMSDQKKKLVAYHEAGHAILGALMNDYDVVAKISIVPRGPAGGVTIFMPSEDRLNSGLYSKEFLENRMCVALGGRLAEEIINGKDNVTTGASNDFQQCTQVAKQMVMTLGMSPEIGQRLLGGQQGGGPFMGRDFMGQGAPPMSQALKQKVDGEIKRIVDEQYQRGMKLLRDNMYLLDELAKLLLEEEKVSGEQLMKLINKAAAEGKLVMGNSKMAVAAYTGEVIENSSEVSLPRKTQCVHPDKPMMFACADCPRRGFCGSSRAAPRDGKAARSAVARLGLATPEAESRESTSEEVLRRIKGMAAEVSPSGAALPESVVKNAAVQALAVLAASSGPLAAKADDVPALQSMGTPQMQMQQPGGGAQRVSGRVTYSRLLEFVDEGSVKRVDFYDLGRTAVATVTVAGREQQLVCDLPGATTGLIEKLTTKGISIEVHQPEKPNPIFNVLGDVAFPLLLIAGLLFLRSRAPGGGGIPGFGNQGQAKIMITPETGVKFEDVAGIDEAKEKAPCIVFIDEIDAIGRQRGAGMGGGNDEREQTLNQILTEMDGFEGNSGVIVVAATNRSDILDNALLRPGRFDRRVQVGLPDVKGRAQILEVHVKNKKLDGEITLMDIAKRTAGFSGADLENLMNESAILAARRNKKAISMDEINDATDRVIAGLEGRALQDNAAKKLIAYHEAGHAIVGTLLPYHDPVNKVTLIPRGQAKGLTWFTPGEDQSLISAAMLKARIAGALGGRAAEQLVFGTSQVTTGAGGDLQQVERMARAMVTQFGMSDVGSLAIDDGGFMGPDYSEELSSKIDNAIKDISDDCYLNALNILMTNRACLDRVADELTETETMTGDRLRELIAEYVEIPSKLAAV
ncbi:ftsH [Symbiodinium sp. KB8]|nr:ftsH [Symbiodinium sp. KB8]